MVGRLRFDPSSAGEPRCGPCLRLTCSAKGSRHRGLEQRFAQVAQTGRAPLSTLGCLLGGDRLALDLISHDASTTEWSILPHLPHQVNPTCTQLTTGLWPEYRGLCLWSNHRVVFRLSARQEEPPW